MPFTAEELADMARADAEIEAGFYVTNEEFALSRERDREAALAAMDPQKRKLAESQRRYYAANKEKVAESKQALQSARRSICLSQARVAELFGVSQATISYWENVSAPENWREIVEIILTKGKAAAPAGTRTTAVTINR